MVTTRNLYNQSRVSSIPASPHSTPLRAGNSQDPLRQTLRHSLLQPDVDRIIVHQIRPQSRLPQLSDKLDTLLHESVSERADVDVASTGRPAERPVGFGVEIDEPLALGRLILAYEEGDTLEGNLEREALETRVGQRWPAKKSQRE